MPNGTCTLTATLVSLNTGNPVSGSVVRFKLIGPNNIHYTSSGDVVNRTEVTATTDASGNISVTVARNDQLTPAGTYWRVMCEDARLVKFISAAQAGPVDVMTLPDVVVADAIFYGVTDPDTEWVAHGHAQTLTTEQQRLARTNIGLDADEAGYDYARIVDATVNFVFEGDSLTAGTVLNPGEDYPTICEDMPGFAGGNFYNVADSGNDIASLVSQYGAQVYPYRPVDPVEVAWLFLWVGTNDAIADPAYSGTSSTALTIATGNGQSITASTGKSWTAGHKIRITYDNVNALHGTVVSYNSETGALVFDCATVVGSGSLSTPYNIRLGPDETAGASAFLTALQGYINTAKNDGFKVVVMTALGYREPYFWYQKKLNAINDGIRKMRATATLKTYDYLVDTYAMFQDSSWGSGDSLHITYAANQALAKQLNEIVSLDGKPRSATGVEQGRLPNPLTLNGSGSVNQIVHLDTSDGRDNGGLFLAASAISSPGARSAGHWMFGRNASSYAGCHYFWTGTAGDYIFLNHATENMRLTNAGRLGIGIASPISALDVNGQITSRLGMVLDDGGATVQTLRLTSTTPGRTVTVTTSTSAFTTTGTGGVRLGGDLSDAVCLAALANTAYVAICVNDQGAGVILGNGTGGLSTYLTVPASGSVLVSTNGSTIGTIIAKQQSFTVGTLPTASANTGVMILVTDESGGATMAFSDGTNWRRVQDRAIVS